MHAWIIMDPFPRDYRLMILFSAKGLETVKLARCVGKGNELTYESGIVVDIFAATK